MEARELKKRLQEEIERIIPASGGDNLKFFGAIDSLLVKYDSDVDKCTLYSDSFNGFSIGIDPEATLEAWQELPDGAGFEAAWDAAVESE